MLSGRQVSSRLFGEGSRVLIDVGWDVLKNALEKQVSH